MTRKRMNSETSSKDGFSETSEDGSSIRDPLAKGIQAQALTQAESLEPHPPQNWIYRPLKEDEIRVLYLEPGHFDSPLHGKFIHVNLLDLSFSDGIPEEESCLEGLCGYEAISYAWGEADFSKDLHLGKTDTIRITSSLDSALRHFRRTHVQRALWADAVCINQSDLEEKSLQVSNMHKVYESSEGILVWLGLSEDSDALAFCTLAAMASVYDPDLPYCDGEDLEPLLSDVDIWVQSHGCATCQNTICLYEDPAISGLLAIRKLYMRPWFSRLWVVQEVLPAQRDHAVYLCSGRHIATWDQFERARLVLNDLTRTELGARRLSTAGVSPKEMRDIRTDFSQHFSTLIDWSQHRSTLMALENLCEFRSRLCSNPLDRLYALNHVLSFNGEIHLRPDYTLCPAEAYTKLALTCLISPIDRDSSFSPACCFALVGTESDRCVSWALPSWVPNVGRLTNRSYKKARRYLNSMQPQFTASGALFRVSPCPNNFWEVRARGCIYATVTSVLAGSHWPALSLDPGRESVSGDFQKIFEWLLGCWNFVLSLWNYQASVPAFVDFVLSGIKDSSRDLDFELEGEMYCYIKSFCTSYLAESTDAKDFWSTGEDCLLRQFFDTTHIWPLVDQKRQLCRITGNGGDDFGWIPRDACVGDLLCLMAGTPFPFVIRSRGNGSYIMLGDAYTSKVTLKEALGGDIVERGDHMVNQCRPGMDWNENSREMRRLRRNIGWITLR